MSGKNNDVEKFIASQINETQFLLNDSIYYKNQKFNPRSEFEEIKDYVNDFLQGDNLNRFITLPGLRGVGKSTILLEIYDYLINEKNILPENILYISCEQLNNIEKCDIYATIEDYVKNFHHSSLKTLNHEIFLLIDESHYDKNWSLAGKMIYDQSRKIFMIFTGSSALNLDYDAEASRRIINYNINPLNYTQHLNLKYGYYPIEFSNSIRNLIFSGDIENTVKLEEKTNHDILNLKGYTSTDWDNYFKFGGFPQVMFDKRQREIVKKIFSSVDTVIRKDLGTIKNITTDTQSYAMRILKFMAQKYPGDVSQNKLSSELKCSFSTINTLFYLFEKIQLLFHFDNYGGINHRIKKAQQYYFATPSIRHIINLKFGVTNFTEDEYDGILFKNFVASSLFNLINNDNFFDFNAYYEKRKGGVDFLVKKNFENPIPIEVGNKNKDKRQVIRAMNIHDSTHGIIISQRDAIEKDGDIIYIPIKSFSYI
ncbi:ATP-binding protein [Methanobrevibacter sp.]|uniref:ATP-binding protein n=1 Tax=Methanobrevibacter sp. TaxID=66852 RepID=UPI003890CD05